MPIPALTIDSTRAITDLCFLGKATGTDKSPINHIGHRHPYTAVYSMLFAAQKNTPIRFAEIGVARGASSMMWDLYFTHDAASLHFFDRDTTFLEHAKGITSAKTHYGLMDVEVDGDVARALKGSSGGELYDSILDDSSHNFDHQIRIIKESLPLLRPGGTLIVEDIFRNESEERYENALEGVMDQCSFVYFVVCEHHARWSPGWDNDKLLVLVKA